MEMNSDLVNLSDFLDSDSSDGDDVLHTYCPIPPRRLSYLS